MPRMRQRKISFTIMIQAKPSVETAALFSTSRCSTKDQNGAPSLKKRKHPEAVSVFQHPIQFTIKAYPQPSAKLTATLSEENFLSPPDCKCGVSENGRYEAESTHP